MKTAIYFIAACAYYTMANGQNTPQNAASNSLAAPNTSTAQQCIAPWQFAELTAAQVGSQTDAYGKTTVALGSYERISPDGRFVLRSFSGGRLGEVSLIELSAAGQVVKAYTTPLSNEAFPVQGSWRYVVDVNGDHYLFSSLLRNNGAAQKAITPLFRGGMTGFYAAAAELPATNPGPGSGSIVRIRSLSWPNASGGDNQGEGALVSRTLQVDVEKHKIVGDSGLTSLCTQRVREDGPLYALPMISVDGLEFAALPQTPPTTAKGQPTMRIYGFGPSGKACEPRATFSAVSGKTIFGFTPERTRPQDPQTMQTAERPPQEAGADLAYEYRGQVWWVHRGAATGGAAGGQPFNIAPYFDNPATQLLASAFPGITQDGRVIYAATLKDCGKDTSGKQCTERSGYVITDPYQSNVWQAFLRQHRGPARRQCITQGDVAQSRAEFAKFHGISP